MSRRYSSLLPKIKQTFLRKYFYIPFLLLVFYANESLGQQLMQFSQFYQTTPYYHPGAVGLDQSVELKALYRNQWGNLAGNPESQFLSASFPLFNINSGAGVVFSNDQIGPQRDVVLRGLYNYQFKIGEGTLSAGISAGIFQKSLNGDELITPTGNYEAGLIEHYDDILPGVRQSATSYDAGLGVYYKGDRLEVGLSGLHLLSGKLQFDGNDAPFSISMVPQVVLSAFYKYEITDRVDLQPMLNVKSDFNNHQIELGLHGIYDNFLWGGISYRGYNNYSFDAVIAMMGVAVTDNLNFGYSYDYTVSQLSAVSSGSHEFFINYSIPVRLPSKGKIINNPRFLSY